MMPTLTVLFDFKDPHSYLAVTPTLTMLDELGARALWRPFLDRPARRPSPPDDAADRGALHRWHRASYQALDLRRYAAALGVAARHFNDDGLYRQSTGEVAAMAFNWAAAQNGDLAIDFLQRMFEGYWDGELQVDSLHDANRTLADAGADWAGFETYSESEGVAALAEQRAALVAEGAFSAPGYLLDGEVFVGRQHLPLIASKLRHGS